jgi:CubicO group peptidase (beta-lactamase class C family)
MTTSVKPEPVDKLFEPFTQPGSPGCALGVMQGGQLIYKRGYGLANLEYDIPVTPATPFPVASMAKQFTAMAIALLADKGELSLDDDVRTHLPALPDFGQPITLRHLIHHTSGMRGDLMLLFAAGWRLEDAMTNDDVLELVKRQRNLNFPPGEKFSYCGTGYLLLASVVEQVSGKSLAKFCQARIFEPLGMANTQFVDNYLRAIRNRAYGYYALGDNRYENAILTCSLVGGTGLFTTIEDLALWYQNLGTGRVGGQAVVEQLQQRGVLNDGTPIDYAYGLMWDTYKGLKVVGHGGDGAGIHAYLLRFPEEHLSVAVLGNCSSVNARGLALQVADLYLADVFREAPSSAAATETIEKEEERLVSRVGRYYDEDSSTFVDIEFKNGHLQVWGHDLLPVSENHFIFAVSPDATAEFVPATKTSSLQVQIDLGMGATRYAWSETMTPTVAALRGYTGRYYSPELAVSWTITLADDKLVIQRRRQGSSSLTPVIADVFTDGWVGSILHVRAKPWALAFERDENQVVSGFRVSDAAGTMRNLRFLRQDAA